MTSTLSVRSFKAVARALRLTSAAAVIGWVLLCLRKSLWRHVRGQPRIPGHWLLGTIPAVSKAAARNEIHKYLFEQHKKLGQTIVPVAPIGLSPVVEAVITTNPKNVEHILKTNFENYPKGFKIRHRFHDLLGSGIFNADGETWYQQRKTTSHMFTAKLFKEHIWVVVNRNARKLRSILQSSQPSHSLDIFNLMNRFTLDTIGEIGFGKCIGSLEDPSCPFLFSFDRAQQITVNRFIAPPLSWELMRFFQVGTERGSKEHFNRLDEYSREVASDLKKSFAGSTEKGTGVGWGDLEAKKSFVGLFLADAQKRNEDVSDDHLRDLVLNFLIAGRDTTAQALSWTIYCLCTNPDAEEKARDEILDVCGTQGPSYEDMNRLPYLNAVLSEALRLYPSVPLDGKIAQTDDVWPDGTFVPAGAMVWYNIYSMGRDQTIWGHDAESFRPERWLEQVEMPDNYHYPVFNGGQRECLGRRLAMVEMKACLAMILPHVRFELAIPADEVCTDSQLTIGMGRGLPCFVKANNNSGDTKSTASTGAQSEDERARLSSEQLSGDE